MTDMPDLSFSAVCKGQYQAGYEAAMKDFLAAMQYLRSLSAKPSLSDRQYLEKIADQVIARNQPKAETSREASPAAGTESVQSGAGVVSVCPALIDDVGGDA